jgi:hypothetical protein
VKENEMAVTLIRNNKPKTVKEWREYISEPWQKAVESIVETGQRLIEARESIEHGKWEEIFKDKKPFSSETARRLLRIAEHPVLQKPTHALVLPPSWYTLYELSQIPAEDLQKLIDAGKIHSDLSRDEVTALKADEKEQKEKAQELWRILSRFADGCIENSLANCGGGNFDCSIFKHNLPREELEELISKTREVQRVWKNLEDHLTMLKEEMK